MAVSCDRLATPSLEVSPSTVDTGTLVTDGSVWQRPIDVRNRSNAPVQLRVRWDCGCVRVDPAALELEPGATASLNVFVSPSPWMDHIASNIYLMDTARPAVIKGIKVRGRVAPLLVAPSQVVQVQVKEADGSAETSVALRNLRSGRFDGAVTLSGDVGRFVRVPDPHVSVGGHDSGTLALTASYPGRRRVRGTLDVTSKSHGGTVLRLPLVLTGIPVVRVTPPSVVFSEGQDEITVRLARSDGKAFALNDVSADATLPLTVDWSAGCRATHHELRVRRVGTSSPLGVMGHVAVATEANEEPARVGIPVLVGGPP